MNKKKNLLKLFADTSEYYFHIIKNDIGHLIYVTKEKNEYSIDNLEFTKNSIIEGFMDDIKDIEFKKVAHSVYFTNETNTEKLKYELSENIVENKHFSEFVKSIKDDYRKTEIDEFIEYTTDPDEYEKRKKEKYEKKQRELWDAYKKQTEELEKQKRKTIKKYNGDLIKLFKENLHDIIINKGKDFKFQEMFMRIILNIIPNDDEQGKLWPKRAKQPIVGNEKFLPIKIKDNKLQILLKDRMSDSYVMDFELNNENLDLVNVSKNNTEPIKDYDFLMKIYDIDVTPNYSDWVNMYESERLHAVIEEIININNKEKEEKEKRRNVFVDSSKAKAFFTIDEYEIQIGEIPGIIGENIKDKLFIPIENKLKEMNIDFIRGDLNNNIEFMNTITGDQIKKLYTFLINKNYMLDTYRQELELYFMDMRKPDTSKYTVYVGWLDENKIYNKDIIEIGFYSSHKKPIVYDQHVSWIDDRISSLFKSLENSYTFFDIGVAENHHLLIIKKEDKSIKEINNIVTNLINKMKNITNNSKNCKWYNK